jgi:hypothetical protein
MSVGSPEVELARGQQFALASEYDWNSAKRFRVYSTERYSCDEVEHEAELFPA